MSLFFALLLSLSAKASDPVLLGYYKNKESVSLEGRARFFRHDLLRNKKNFSFEAQECSASFLELSAPLPLRVEEIRPRVRFAMGQKNLWLGDISQTQWKKAGTEYSFKTKFKVLASSSEAIPVYLFLENALNAETVHLGYEGNDCGLPQEKLPQDWDFEQRDYLKQDQQEYSIQFE